MDEGFFHFDELYSAKLVIIRNPKRNMRDNNVLSSNYYLICRVDETDLSLDILNAL